MSYVYNGKFEGNILVVGRTGCGKTGFVQQLGLNKFFGDLIQVEWVSYVKLDKKREAQIQSCFDCQTDFYYPRNKDKFENLLEYFKTKSSEEYLDEKSRDEAHSTEVIENGNIGFGENSTRDRLIIMDDVFGLADTSSKFANFLTVSRKYKYHCLYIFHTIHPEKGIWKTILSQTNILNIFPASVPLTTVKRILEANCVRQTTKYIPVNSLWMTKLFITLANNKNDKTCLTIDCTSLNINGPGRYRTEAADLNKHTCYFNKSDDDMLYNIFISKRIKEKSNKLLFKIEGLKTQTDDETYSVSSELENLQGNGLSNVGNAELETGYGNREQSNKFRSKWKCVKPRFLPG